MIKVAISQPCFFPYLGYYQLINASDIFVVYDDVTYMKGKWINRNRILVNGQEYMFSLPLKSASSFNLISNISVDISRFNYWREKFLATLRHSYRRAPFYKDTMDIISLALDSKDGLLAGYCCKSLKSVFDYVNIDVNILPSSSGLGGVHLDRIQRLVHIVRNQGGSIYINSAGGRQLYKTDDFSQSGISLRFLDSSLPVYSQSTLSPGKYIPSLSMIDILMNCSPEQIRHMMSQYSLSST